MTTRMSMHYPFGMAARAALFGWRCASSLVASLPALRLVRVLSFALLVAGTIVVSYVVLRYIAWPGYVDPQSRMYTSRLGYAALLRHQGLPFPVTTTTPQYRWLTQRFTGEGFIRARPTLVPIVPMARIVRVHVDVGDRVQQGDLLIEMDKTLARLRLDAAKVAFEIAKAELERTRIGTVYVLGQERPEQNAIDANSARQQAAIKNELDVRAEDLFRKKLISKEQMLQRKLDNVKISAEVEKTEVALKNSQLGRKQSIRIAEAELRAAYLAYKQRETELSEYEIRAPADGLIERRLVNDGEYNQDPGRPAFLLAVGQWFEAYFDQTVTGKVSVGDVGTVQLEAFAGHTLNATVSLVKPVIAFSSSGPEVTRPIRPSGTGAPEWPSSFPVRFQLAPTNLPVAIGLSGFARVEKQRNALCVPTSAVLSQAAGSGQVYVLVDDTFEIRTVTLGDTADGWTEIRAGLELVDEVITEGHHALIEGDCVTADDLLGNTAVAGKTMGR